MAQKIIKTYRKFGNYDVGLVQYNNNKKDTYLYVRGSNYGENPTIYEDGRVAYDNPEKYSKRVKEYISKNSLKFKKDIYNERLN